MEKLKIVCRKLLNCLNSPVPQKAVQKKDILIWGFIGAFAFISIYGLLPLDVTYDHWLINGYDGSDATQHYAGWMAFRRSPWSLPLGIIDGLGGTAVTYTDSIPLAAVFFKILRGILPETFQFFGIYIFFCFILQGISSGLLISIFSKDKIFTCLGVILFCYSPIMIDRAFKHTALASHWLILFTLYFYFKSRESGKMSLWNSLICVLSMGIHPYFLPIIFGLVFANAIELSIRDKKQIYRSVGVSLVSLLLTVSFGYLIGALGTSSSLSGHGYGYFSMNLNAIVNPQGGSRIIWSKFLKPLPQILGNYDGFNYLGLGGIFLLFLTVITAIVNREQSINWIKKNFALIILSAGFWIFAVSNVVTFNGKILFTYPLPETVLSFASIFRASSRIFYPVYYLLILSGINGIYVLINANWKNLVLLAAVFIQLIDISPALSLKWRSFDRENIEKTYQASSFTGSLLWNSIAGSCEKIKMLDNTGDYKLAAFGEKYHLSPDLSISSSHYSGGIDLNRIYQENYHEIAAGNLDISAAYVTSDENFLPLLLP